MYPLPDQEVTNALGTALKQSAEMLIPLFYSELRRGARYERSRVAAGETLQTTALIHEAYLKLRSVEAFNDRAHFLRAAALAMRHVLINHARERLAIKRGSGVRVESLDEMVHAEVCDDQALLDVGDALAKLSTLDPRLAQIVECRFFAGFDDQETALALGLTDRTIRRDWIKARAWLRRELADSENAD